MNKLIKGSIAGAAGIALLLGGAGTLASWNDKASIDGGTISAGQLKLAHSATAGTWSVTRGTSVTNNVNINTFKVVPGDVLSFSQDVTLKADGSNLVATLAIAEGTVAGVVVPGAGSAVVDQNKANAALANFIAANATLTVTGPSTGITANGNGTFKVTAGAGVSTTVKATVSLTFSNNAPGAENDAMSGAVTFAGAEVSVIQN